MKVEMPEMSLSRPSTFASLEHFFSWCALQERYYADRVKRNPKTSAVNSKLTVWHRENPDIVNVAAWRIERAKRNQR